MKKFVLIAIAMSLFVPNAFAKLETVKSVDLGKFVGVWYRISANPIVFEPKSKCARQVLMPTADSKVAVYNSGNRFSNGELFEIRGTAEAIDETGSKLEVDFGLPWKGSYWIIALDPEYRYAAVTDSHGYSLYIMSRFPTLDQELYKKAVAEVSTKINTDKLRMEDQSNCTYPPLD
jgi:apolipoprotein D and lipocalin family protein